MAKKILILGVAIIMAFGLVACGGGKNIAFNIAESGVSAEGMETHPTVTKLIKSVGELEQLCNETGLISDGQKYSAAWFEGKALIILSFIEESSSINNQVDGVKVQNETVVVNIIRRVPKNGILLGAEKYEFFLIEVGQADIAQTNTVEISRTNKNK